MQTFTFQRSSKALSVHVDGCNISVSSALLRGVRPKPKHHARMERAAAAPRIKRRHSSPRVDRQRSVMVQLGNPDSISRILFGLRPACRIDPRRDDHRIARRAPQARCSGASKPFVFAQASDESRSVGVTPIRHFELPRKCPAAPDPRRSLATIVCRPIRVRYTCLSSVFTRMPFLPDRYRSSPNIAN
jgi:hypothetical protein